MRFAINLLWVRPGKVGGTEFVIRNLMDGFEQLPDSFEAVLIVSRDNRASFEHYLAEDSRFSMITADVESAGIMNRIVWQNLHLNALLRRNGLRECFSPVYDRPWLNGGIRYINVIHDIQAYHYPQYHPFHEVFYSKMIWRACRDRSLANVCITNYVRDDIIKAYRFNTDRLRVIYNPVVIHQDEFVPFDDLAQRYAIESGEYYYTVGQLIPHKNITTLLKVMKQIVEQNIDLPKRLLISGINGNAAEEINQLIEELHLEEHVTLTGFVQNSERNALYKNARAFLFSSVFEGFGIPPIEAMMCGATVIATRCTCIPEVTQELAAYVEDPYDVEEWIRVMRDPVCHSEQLNWQPYELQHIARQYLDYLTQVWTKEPS